MSRDPWAEVAHVRPAPTPLVDVDQVVREAQRLERLREFITAEPPRSENP